MKKLCAAAALVLLLSGCSEPEAFETMSDIYTEPEQAAVRQTELVLPEDAALSVAEQNHAGKLYLCEDYSIAVLTVAAGDLDATLQSVTGYPRDRLRLISRRDGDAMRYECVWAAAGEGTDQLGRAVILDDGNFHYTITVMADADKAGTLADTWQALLDSFRLTQP